MKIRPYSILITVFTAYLLILTPITANLAQPTEPIINIEPLVLPLSTTASISITAVNDSVLVGIPDKHPLFVQAIDHRLDVSTAPDRVNDDNVFEIPNHSGLLFTELNSTANLMDLYAADLSLNNVQTLPLPVRVRSIIGGTSPQQSVGAASEDGWLVVIVSGQHLDICDRNNGCSVRTLSGVTCGYLFQAAMSGDGQFVAGLSGAGETGDLQLTIWRVDSGKILAQLSTDDRGESVDDMSSMLTFVNNHVLICGKFILDLEGSLVKRSPDRFAPSVRPLGIFADRALLCYDSKADCVSIWKVSPLHRISSYLKLKGMALRDDSEVSQRAHFGVCTGANHVWCESETRNNLLEFDLPRTGN